MGNRQATRAGLNLRIKSLSGLRYRAAVRRSWGFSVNEFWKYQADAFRRIYEFARQRVPYYMQRLDAYPPMPPR